MRSAFSPYARFSIAAVIGAGFVVLGLLANSWLLGLLFAPDGIINGSPLTAIYLLQVCFCVTGAAFFLGGPSIDRVLLATVRRRPNVAAALVGATGLLAALTGVELGFYAYNTIAERHRPKTIITYSAPLWQENVACRSAKLIADHLVYDVTYHRDATGARVTPDSPVESTGRDLVFLGGSFSFGQGVEDEDTLPNQVAQLAPEWRVTNFGYPGHGPAQMLQRVEQPGSTDTFAGSELIALDVFIPDHVRRTIGSMRVATTWGREAPCFQLQPDGQLAYRGVMDTARPYLTPIYEWLAAEPVMKCFNIDIPIRVRPSDCELTVRIIRESRDRLARQIPEVDFRVVLFPDTPHAEFPASRLIPLLKTAGINYLDYSRRLQGDDGMWIPGDGHPTPQAYSQVAAWIAEDLGISPGMRRMAPKTVATD